MVEIERKFLVISNAYRDMAFNKSQIIQGFLNTDPKRTIRIRIRDGKCDITIKGLSSEDGLTRFEWESEISEQDALALLKLCDRPFVTKQRYEVKEGKHVFEIDEFENDNSGLIIAEIELNHTDEEFEKPDWLGEEVTGQVKYYNSNLYLNPYNKWN